MADGSVSYVEGSFLDAFTVGDGHSGTFVYDTEEVLAGPGSSSTPSTVSGHEYTSFYEFLSAPYGVSLSFPVIPANFDVETIGVVVNDDLAPSYTALLLGIEFDELGNETGVVFASVNVTEAGPSPVPALGLLGIGIVMGLPARGLRHQARRRGRSAGTA